MLHDVGDFELLQIEQPADTVAIRLLEAALAVKMVESTPELLVGGMNVFLISGVVKEAKVEHVFRGVLPFIFAELCVVLLIVLVPDLVTWLPELASSK